MSDGLDHGLVDLAAARVGGKAILANDEFFAPRDNLIKPGRGVFIEGRYTSRGKWMDGWETRRRRTPGYDWCIVRLGIAGVIHAATVDTNHFRGNYPESCSLEAVDLTASPKQERKSLARAAWREILPRSALSGHTENKFPIPSSDRFRYVRLNIFPDGGVARLRVWGEARPDWTALITAGERLDLASVQLGALPLGSSDQFYSDPLNLLMPGPSADMGDGWETKRRRGPGHDWVVIRLGHRGTIDAVVVDTTHFKGNYPESCRLEALDAPNLGRSEPPGESAVWRELVPRTKLRANAPHRFRAIGRSGPVTHLRLSIFPDGGVARLRVYGKPVDR